VISVPLWWTKRLMVDGGWPMALCFRKDKVMTNLFNIWEWNLN